MERQRGAADQGGFAFTPQQLFVLVAVPNLVGSLLRLPYTFAVPKFGGRNWTVVSALLLLVPTLLFAYFVQRPETPYWVFLRDRGDGRPRRRQLRLVDGQHQLLLPDRLKGTALGLNAAGGNVGVAVIQFFLPIIVGGAGAFGLVKASQSGMSSSGPATCTPPSRSSRPVCAYFFMNNLSAA